MPEPIPSRGPDVSAMPQIQELIPKVQFPDWTSIEPISQIESESPIGVVEQETEPISNRDRL